MQDKQTLLRIFLAAAQAPSFRSAAAALELSPQVVTRAVQALEAELGEVLFHRSTRSSVLSEFGQRFAAEAEAALAQFDRLFDTPRSAARERPEGLVRIVAPTMHGRRFLLPVLLRLGKTHPGLSFDLRLSDEPVDAVQMRADIGLHGGSLLDNRFVARTVARVSQHVCAAPDLLAQLGRLRSARDLDAVPTTQLIERATGRPWPWEFRNGLRFTPARTVFASDDPLVECEAVLAGLGVGQLSSVVAAEHLRSGRLVELLPGTVSRAWPLTLFRVRRDPVPLRVRITYDALLAAFAED